MADHSEGRPAGGAAPVFVDNSGGRRRTWRRLGIAMGVVGGGYALVVAMSVIGGNSDAPWGVLIPGTGDGGSGAVRVVPEQEEGARKQMPGTAAGTAEPGASASASSGPADADRPRTPGSSTKKEQPSGRPASVEDGKASASRGKGASGASGGSASSGGAANGGAGGSAPTPENPPAEAGSGGATGSTGGTPSDPGDGPDEPAPSEPPPGGGLLEDILAPILGGGAPAQGAE